MAQETFGVSTPRLLLLQDQGALLVCHHCTSNCARAFTNPAMRSCNQQHAHAFHSTVAYRAAGLHTGRGVRTQQLPTYMTRNRHGKPPLFCAIAA